MDNAGWGGAAAGFLGLLGYAWRKRDVISDVAQGIILGRRARIMEKNALGISEMYDIMGAILHSMPDAATRVSVAKFHNGMSAITMHSNISMTIIHELCGEGEKPLKSYIQNSPCDAASIESLAKSVSSSRDCGVSYQPARPPFGGYCSNVCAEIGGVKFIYSISIYISPRYVLLLNVYSNRELLVGEQTEIQHKASKMRILCGMRI